MDLSERAVRIVRGALELSPDLRRREPTKRLLVEASAWNTYPRDKKLPGLKVKAVNWERDFMVEAVSSTADRTKPLWARNAGWALFFLARSLDLRAQNLVPQAEKQLEYAEEELQLGASAKAFVRARTARPKYASNSRKR